MPSAKSKTSETALPSTTTQSVLAKDATIAYLVREAHRALALDLQNRIGPYGVNVGVWRFLRELWEQDGISQRELSARVGMRAPTTVTALDRMERQGLVLRSRNITDRRVINVNLTEKGRALRDELLPFAAEANAVACTGFSAEETALLRRLLMALKQNIEQYGQSSGDADVE